MPLDYIGLAAAVGLYTVCLLWLCRLIVNLTPRDEE